MASRSDQPPVGVAQPTTRLGHLALDMRNPLVTLAGKASPFQSAITGAALVPYCVMVTVEALGDCPIRSVRGFAGLSVCVVVVAMHRVIAGGMVILWETIRKAAGGHAMPASSLRAIRNAVALQERLDAFAALTTPERASVLRENAFTIASLSGLVPSEVVARAIDLVERGVDPDRVVSMRPIEFVMASSKPTTEGQS